MIVLSATRSKRLTSTVPQLASSPTTIRSIVSNDLGTYDVWIPQDHPIDHSNRLCVEDEAFFYLCCRVIDENTKQGAVVDPVEPEKHPGTTIVTDSVTSDGITTFIQKKLGGKHHQFKRGNKNVIVEGIRLTSGHGALKENHWLDDGAYLMHLWTPESRPMVDLGDTSSDVGG
ncbi:hypothetical protein L2E82_13398 [Cichorium intybus]|uniref:Uncharacterized protein n=1 Tax=Cichorium intybus TaxID=13427 RepID=A0ACB9EYK0_CICIN|nr:hypothetical protein L2E82_13398 [Cichorium intybus]